MRIASLVPSATEMVFALGLGDQLVAVTHECDYPLEALELPRLTRTVVPDGLSAAEIDAAVREISGQGKHLYELDEATLAALDVDLIVTQQLCEVCAVSFDDVRAVAARLPAKPAVISQDPNRLEDMLGDAVALAAAVGMPDRGVALRAQLEQQLDTVRAAVDGAARPRVLALEWLDPPFIGGHWVPEMIEIAGGECVIGEAGARSETVEWHRLSAAGADLIVAMPCGWDAARAYTEVLGHSERIAAIGAERVVAVDAAASFSRPGPRLVEGVELLAHLLHPDRVSVPGTVEFRVVESLSAAGAGTSTSTSR